MCLIHDALALLAAGTTFTAGLSAFAAMTFRRKTGHNTTTI